MPSQTLSFAITGNSSSASQAFKDAAAAAAIAGKAAKELSDRLALQSRTAQVSAGATLSMARSDKILADAEAELSGAAAEARRQLREQGDAADRAALQTRLAAGAAKGGAGSFGALATPMGAAIAAGVSLAPVLVTVATGLGGLAIAGYGAVAPVIAAAGAAGGLKANMSSLSPVQQQMGRELLALEGQASAFSKSLQPQVTTLFGDAIAFAGGALRDVQPVARATGDALHGVLAAIGGDLHGPEWQQFFQFMASTAAPDVQLLGMNFREVLNLLPPLLESLQPLATELLQATGGVLQLANGLVQLEGAATRLGGGSKLWGAFKGAIDLVMPVTGALRAASGLMTQFDGSATKAAKATRAVSVAAVQAHPAIGTLAGDMYALDSSTGNATTTLSAFNDMWNRIVGNSLSDQAAVLADAQAFDTLQKDITKNGASSDIARQAFVAYMQRVGTSLSTLVQNKASVADVNSAYTTNIRNLQSLHSLTPQQRQDIAGLVKDYGLWANTTVGLGKSTLTAAGIIGSQFLSAMTATAQKSPQVKSDIEAISASILKTGATSASTAGDRARLIADLKKSGVNAQDAAGLVAALQQQIDRLHGKSVNVGLTTSGSGQIIVTGTGIGTRTINTGTGQVAAVGGRTAAAGWHVSGGIPGRDSVPVLAMPGELIVPAPMVAGGAVDHLRGRIPGFASGGVVGKAGSAASGIGAAEAQWGQLAAQAFALSAVQASAKAAAGGAFTAGAPATGSAAAAQRFAQSVLPGGWSWPDLQALWQRESGWNAYAVNPGSGAYGIPQSLGHGHPYNLGDYANQVRWGIGYVAGRYFDSQNAWAHEQSAGWYGNGLDGIFSRPTVIGVGERGAERVQVTPVTAGRGGGASTLNLTVNINAPVGSKAELKNWLVDGINEAAREGKLTYALRHSPSAG